VRPIIEITVGDFFEPPRNPIGIGVSVLEEELRRSIIEIEKRAALIRIYVTKLHTIPKRGWGGGSERERGTKRGGGKEGGRGRRRGRKEGGRRTSPPSFYIQEPHRASPNKQFGSPFPAKILEDKERTPRGAISSLGKQFEELLRESP